MANRFPLIINTVANQIQELASGDFLDLSSSGISNSGNITCTNVSISGTLTSSIVTGTAPFIVTSTTQVANLSVATAGLATYATTANAVAGANVSGSVSSATTAGTVTTAAQPNITSTGSLVNTQTSSLGVGTAASGTSGEIRATNNITAYYSSDIKFKENIRNIPNALETVNQIGGKLFDWTDEYIASHGGEDGYFIQKSDFGVIAQDALKNFPVAIRKRPDGSLAVDYEKLSALAFAAIQELTTRLEHLESQVAKLENK
jgi:hypothetical protein